MSGPIGLEGAPGTGKSTKARELAIESAWRARVPLVVTDTTGSEVFQDMPHAESLDHLTDLVWGLHQDVAYTPKDKDDFAALCGAIYGARFQDGRVDPVVLLVDELYNVMPSVRSVPDNYQRILREWRRVMPHGSYFTSQLYRDSGRVIRGLVSEWYFFRMIGSEDQEDIQKDHAIPADVIKTLPTAKECALAGRPISDAYKHVVVGVAA